MSGKCPFSARATCAGAGPGTGWRRSRGLGCRGEAEGCAPLLPSPGRPSGARVPGWQRGSVSFQPRGFGGGAGCRQMSPLQGGGGEAGLSRALTSLMTCRWLRGQVGPAVESHPAGAVGGNRFPPRPPSSSAGRIQQSPPGQGGGIEAWSPVNLSFGVWTDS